MTVWERWQAITQELLDAGIPATLDRRNINPPCVLVTLAGTDWDLYAGHVSAEWRLLAIVPGAESADTLQALWGPDGLLPALDTVDGLDVRTASPTTHTDNTTAVQLTWTEAI